MLRTIMIVLAITAGLTADAQLVFTNLNLAPGTQSSNPSRMMSLNGKLFLAAMTDTTGREPWVSDGTHAGSHMIKDIRPGDT